MAADFAVSINEAMDLKATLEKFTKENEQLQMYARRMEITATFAEEERKIVEEEIKVPLLITTMLYTNNENIAKSLNLQIPEGSTLLDEVLKLDEETFNTVISSIEQSIKSMDNMVLDQYAISGIKSIYNEIGMDMNQYQINYIINKGLTMLSIAGIGMVI